MLLRHTRRIPTLRIQSALAVLAAIVAVVACGGSPDPTATQATGGASTPTPAVNASGGGFVITIYMSAPTGSFQVGQAVMESVDGGTRITVDVEPPGDAAQPMHIHSGTCDDVGDVIHSLENVVRGHSVSMIELPITELAVPSRLINVHRSFQDFPTYTACGELPDLP